MESYIKIIREASIFMIIGELLMQLAPSAEYTKYIRFLLDMICVMLLFFPIVSTLQQEEPICYIEELVTEEQLLEEEIASWEEKVGQLLIENTELVSEETSEQEECKEE